MSEQPEIKASTEASKSAVEPVVSLRDPHQYLESGDYLPEILKDFHDQKDIFKAMHILFERNIEPHHDRNKMPNWIDGQVYTIDWFLWYMAGRGYTLQKSRAKVDFWDFENPRDLTKSMAELLAG